MKNSQFTIDEMMSVLRRRKRAFMIPPIIILSVCVLGAFTLPRQYESTTTILIQPNEVLSQLMTYIFPSSQGSQDKYSNPISDLNEVVYSHPTIEALIDSLGIRKGAAAEMSDDQLVAEIRKQIETDILGANSFKITYSDTSPALAQRGVTVLTNLIIDNKVGIENQKSEFAVHFFQKKVEQLQQTFMQSQDALIAQLKQRANLLPADDRRLLYGEMMTNSSTIDNTQALLQSYENSLRIVDNVVDSGVTSSNVQSLYQLQLADIPFSTELRTSLDAYTKLTQRYTSEYPGVVKAKEDVFIMLQKVRDGLNSVISQTREKLAGLQKRKMETVASLEQATVAQTQDQAMQNTFDTYKNLYENMRVSLERAQTMRDLEEKAADQFVIINPPVLPTRPSKPNKALIIGGGIGAGLFVGLLAAGLVELFDTRIRTPRDLEMFERPIIAYLPAPVVKTKK